MPGIMKNAKLKAIMDIMSQMDDMEMERMMPKESMDMEEEVKPEKKGITIVKLESDKKPMMEMEEEGEEEEDDEEESVDPYSVLGRLKARMKKGM